MTKQAIENFFKTTQQSQTIEAERDIVPEVIIHSTN